MERLRIDKWLWAARFYKTRSLASEAIDKGRVQVNGQPVKPAREVKTGDTVAMRHPGGHHRTVEVLAISAARGPAPVARLLYQETAESVQVNLAAAEQRRYASEPAHTITQGRPTKRDRRALNEAAGDAGAWGDRWSASVDGGGDR